MTDEQKPIQPLSYQTPLARPRRWRVLPVAVAIVVVICGTLLTATPCIVAATYSGGAPDYLVGLWWVTEAFGFIVIVSGVLLTAPRRRTDH